MNWTIVVAGQGVNSLKVNWGGKQPSMRNSTMVLGCLVDDEPLLKIGEIQTMNFEENEAPFYQPDAPKFDKPGKLLL